VRAALLSPSLAGKQSCDLDNEGGNERCRDDDKYDQGEGVREGVQKSVQHAPLRERKRTNGTAADYFSGSRGSAIERGWAVSWDLTCVDMCEGYILTSPRRNTTQPSPRVCCSEEIGRVEKGHGQAQA